MRIRENREMNLIVDDEKSLADMLAINADFEQARDCAEIYLSGEFKGRMRVQRALYESALISYRRGLKNGSSRRTGPTWRIPKEVKKRALTDLEDKESEILFVAEKCVAHRATNEAREVDVLPGGDTIAATRYRERTDLVLALRTIATRYISIIQTELVPSVVTLEQIG